MDLRDFLFFFIHLRAQIVFENEKEINYLGLRASVSVWFCVWWKGQRQKIAREKNTNYLMCSEKSQIAHTILSDFCPYYEFAIFKAWDL